MVFKGAARNQGGEERRSSRDHGFLAVQRNSNNNNKKNKVSGVCLKNIGMEKKNTKANKRPPAVQAAS